MSATKRRTVQNPSGSENITVEIDPQAFKHDESEVTLTRSDTRETADFRVDSNELATYQGKGSAPVWTEAVLDRIGLVLAARRGQ